METVKSVETVETVESVESVETAETAETVKTVECTDCRDCIDCGSEKVSLTHLLTTRKQEMLAHLKLTGNLVKKHIADKLGH